MSTVSVWIFPRASSRPPGWCTPRHPSPIIKKQADGNARLTACFRAYCVPAAPPPSATGKTRRALLARFAARPPSLALSPLLLLPRNAEGNTATPHAPETIPRPYPHPIAPFRRPPSVLLPHPSPFVIKTTPPSPLRRETFESSSPTTPHLARPYRATVPNGEIRAISPRRKTNRNAQAIAARNAPLNAA